MAILNVVSAGWIDHWEARRKDQGNTSAVWCVCIHCRPRWRIRWSYHYDRWYQWPDTLCPVSASDEVCMFATVVS